MNAIELKLEDIYRGKATMIKNNKYFTTQQYIEPFVDRVDKMCQGNFIVKALPAKQISLTPQGQIDTEDIVFNRVNIEAVLPGEFEYEGHQQVLGAIYALDTRKPVYKLYMGAIRSACLNLTVFDSQALLVNSLLPETPIDYTFLEMCSKIATTIHTKLQQLKAIHYTKEECTSMLGAWIDRTIQNKLVTDFGTIKISEDLPIEAYKNLFYNEKSEYFTNSKEITGFEAYQSFTDILCNKKGADLVNKFEKCWLISKIMDIQ